MPGQVLDRARIDLRRKNESGGLSRSDQEDLNILDDHEKKVGPAPKDRVRSKKSEGRVKRAGLAERDPDLWENWYAWLERRGEANPTEALFAAWMERNYPEWTYRVDELWESEDRKYFRPRPPARSRKKQLEARRQKRAADEWRRPSYKGEGEQPKNWTPSGGARQKLRPGDYVEVVHGSGLDSGKRGKVVDRSAVKTDGRGVPTNVDGAYKPVDWKAEVAVQLDDGSLITIYKERLIKLERSEARSKRGATGKGRYRFEVRDKDKLLYEGREGDPEKARGLAEEFRGRHGGSAFVSDTETDDILHEKHSRRRRPFVGRRSRSVN